MEFEMKVTSDLSGFDKMAKDVKLLNRRHIRFGWFDGKTYPATHDNAGLTYAQVAYYQDFGVGLAQRPYFRQSTNITKYGHRQEIASIFGTATRGGDTILKLEKLAEGIHNDYRKSVARQNYKALSPVTVAIKGHGYQMVDSTLMTQNYQAKVYKTSQATTGS